MHRGQITYHADDDVLLRDIEPQGAVEGVPPTKNHGKIGPHPLADDGVVNAVHAGGHKDFVQGSLQEQGQAQVGVLEHIGSPVGPFVQQIGEGVHSQKANLKDQEARGVKDLPKMEAGCGRYAQIGIQMMDTSLKGNKMGHWRILKAILILTNVHFCVIWYNNLAAGTFDERGTGEYPGDRRSI